MIWLRRTVQLVLLLLFFSLFLGNAGQGGEEPRGPVTFFFDIDPLLLLASFLGTGELATGLLLGLATLAFTLVMGRFFCGWICPLGTLHNVVSAFRPEPPARARHKFAWSPWQRSKYYILAAFLVACLLGVQLTGFLDPICFLVRSMTAAVYPALLALVEGTFNFLYQENPLGISGISEPVYEFLKKQYLPYQSFAYTGGVFLGILFAAALGLNLWRPRFWCRYICPLGALLGLCSRYTAFKLKVDPDLCGNCNLCVVPCQSGADPHLPGAWRNDECTFCWNCKAACPKGAIRFQFEWPSLRISPRQQEVKNGTQREKGEIAP